MPPFARLALTSLILTAAALSAVRAQDPVSDPPKPLTPAHPETREELNRREAVKQYGLGVFHQHDNRLLAAVRAFEEATRLDPEAAAAYKALVPLYLGLDRLDDALSACRKALDLDPGDYSTWHLYARQLRVHDRRADAADALDRALACPKLKDHPEVRVQIAFDLALLRADLNEFDKAESAYLEVVKVLEHPALLAENADLDPDEIAGQTAETYERLGRVSLRAGKHDKARDYFLKARDTIKDKDPIRANRLAYNLAELYMAKEEWKSALESLDEYLAMWPKEAEAYRAKIKALQKLGRRDEVLPWLEKSVLRDGDNTALRLLYAEQLGLAGRFNDAERTYNRLAEDTATPEVYRGLFQLYTANRRFDKVLTVLDDNLGAAAGKKDGQEGDAAAAARSRSMLVVLRDDAGLVRGLIPEVKTRLTARESLNATTCFFLGVLAARTQQLDGAEQLFRACLPQPGRNPRLVEKEAEVYSNLLRVLRSAHKHEAIVEVCRDGLENAQATRTYYFHLQMAQAFARLGKLAKALEEADAAIAEAPDPSRLLCRDTRIHILIQAERYEQAVAECKDLLKEETNPEDIRQVRHTLSVVYSAAHEPAKAEEQLQILLEADANDATANNDLGYQWADQGKNLEQAEKLIRKAIELDRKQRVTGTTLGTEADRDNFAYVDSLGWVLFRRGKHEEARKELEKAAALPDGVEDPTVWDHLGDVRARLGDQVKAKEAWTKAIELYEVAHERQLDDRYKEIKAKLKK